MCSMNQELIKELIGVLSYFDKGLADSKIVKNFER